MSIDQMLNWRPSRRDDMESLGYTVLSLCGNVTNIEVLIVVIIRQSLLHIPLHSMSCKISVKYA